MKFNSDFIQSIGSSSKLRMLDRLLSDVKEEDNVVIFSHFVTFLHIISAHLAKAGVSHSVFLKVDRRLYG